MKVTFPACDEIFKWPHALSVWQGKNTFSGKMEIQTNKQALWNKLCPKMTLKAHCGKYPASSHRSNVLKVNSCFNAQGKYKWKWLLFDNCWKSRNADVLPRIRQFCLRAKCTEINCIYLQEVDVQYPFIWYSLLISHSQKNCYDKTELLPNLTFLQFTHSNIAYKIFGT